MRYVRIATAIVLAHFLLPNPAAAQSRDISWLQAYRFASRTTFGPKRAEIAQIQRDGYEAWLNAQFNAPLSRYPEYLHERFIDASQDYFFQMAMRSDDQLRQRVAFALHKIFVVSAVEVPNPRAITSYQNLLAGLAFDNIYAILLQVTLHPAMGEYLNMVNNDRAQPGSITAPNENYARELLQLFSIGLTQLNPDGTPKLDEAGNPIPTYTEDDVKSFTRALTGWTYPSVPGARPDSRGHNPPNYATFMTANEDNHDPGAKTLLNGVDLPEGRTARQDLDSVIGNLYSHPNLAPFLSKQLIQQLVTSNPSPAYVARVSAAFDDNGAGVKGDLKAVLRAILLDSEALDPPAESSGHLKEPALAVLSLVRPLGMPTNAFNLLAFETGLMGQRVLFAPSVFSYFSPNYRVPGSAGLTGPEFQILNSQTALARANFAAKYLFGTYGLAWQPDLQRYTEASANTGELLRRVDEDLLGGWMHEAPAGAAMREAIAAAVDAQEDAASKAATALYLVATSAQFQVVR